MTRLHSYLNFAGNSDRVLFLRGVIEMPIADQVWGDCYGGLKDKLGSSGC